jgi:hypothetical protein
MWRKVLIRLVETSAANLLRCAAVPSSNITDDLDHTHFLSSEITRNRAALAAGFTISLSSCSQAAAFAPFCGSIKIQNTVKRCSNSIKLLHFAGLPQ